MRIRRLPLLPIFLMNKLCLPMEIITLSSATIVANSATLPLNVMLKREVNLKRIKEKEGIRTRKSVALVANIIKANADMLTMVTIPIIIMDKEMRPIMSVMKFLCLFWIQTLKA